ncbi:hypothetical protein KIN20_021598 [Parelaphostrongylus tenuis]|uniref:Uncharacterized protein n=1 Tax=Parelaphostrongylus tenuis TaxID=148309 RepID=A0AAD5MUD1_PARTN|nr:hypothetical protein KIN20_021598 [Parelaphostrongylus tenuis]
MSGAGISTSADIPDFRSPVKKIRLHTSTRSPPQGRTGDTRNTKNHQDGRRQKTTHSDQPNLEKRRTS